MAPRRHAKVGEQPAEIPLPAAFRGSRLAFRGSGDALGGELPRVFGAFEVRSAFVGRAVGVFAAGLGFGFAFAIAIGRLVGMTFTGAGARRRLSARRFVPEAVAINSEQLLPCPFLVRELVSFQQFEHRFRSQRGMLQGTSNARPSQLHAFARIPRTRAAQLGGNAFRGNVAGQVPTSPVLPGIGEGVQEQTVKQRVRIVMHGRFLRCSKASQHTVGVEVERLRICARQREKRIGGGNERQQTGRRRKERTRDQQPVFRKLQHFNSQLLPFAKLRVHSTSFACGHERG